MVSTKLVGDTLYATGDFGAPSGAATGLTSTVEASGSHAYTIEGQNAQGTQVFLKGYAYIGGTPTAIYIPAYTTY